MPFNRPGLSTIITRVRDDLATRLTVIGGLARSVVDVLARVFGGAHANMYGYLGYIERQIMPDTAEAEQLARWASIWGVRRKGAVPAAGLVTATGTNGVAIPQGSVLVRVDGARYIVQAAAVIAAGTASLSIEAEASGPDGNAEAATQLTFTSPIAGVQAVASVGVGGLTAGEDEEGDDALLARLLQRIRNPADGGALADYERWTLEVAGVTRAWIYPLYLGLGTVGVTFVMDGREDVIPLEADVDAVQAHLDVLRPVTAEVTVFAPVPQSVDMLIRLVPDTAEVRAAVVAELADLFTRDAEPGGIIWRSRVIEAISLASGESHHELLLPSADIETGAGALAQLGDVSWAA